MKILTISAFVLLSTCSIAQADTSFGTIGVNATIGFVAAGGGSCTAGLTITEQSPLDFGEFVANSDGIFVINPQTGGTSTYSGSPEFIASSSPTRGVFLVEQESPGENCDIDVSSPSEGDPGTCYPSQTLNSGGQSIPFRVSLDGNTEIPAGGSVTWYSGGALQTSCSANHGNFSTGTFSGTYTVDVDYL